MADEYTGKAAHQMHAADWAETAAAWLEQQISAEKKDYEEGREAGISLYDEPEGQRQLSLIAKESEWDTLTKGLREVASMLRDHAKDG
jgi:hypothetical protein